jgi:hypothetical protein
MSLADNYFYRKVREERQVKKIFTPFVRFAVDCLLLQQRFDARYNHIQRGNVHPTFRDDDICIAF